MDYIQEAQKKYNGEEIAKLIREKTDFDVFEEITSRTKRKDVLAFILQCDAGRIKQDFEEEEIEIDTEDEEEYISELMNKADEYAVEIEESLPEDLISYYYSYSYDEDEEIIKTILVVSFESLGERKLMDVGNRLITVVE